MAELAEPLSASDAALPPPGATAPPRREEPRPLLARLAVPRTWAEFRAWPVARQFVLALSVVYLAKQLIIALVFPPFSGHDEVAHYDYLRSVAADGRVPVLIEDYLDRDLYRYCSFTLWWGPCEPENPRFLRNPPYLANWGNAGQHPGGQQYAANHPPLYYIMMTPIYWVSESASPAVQQYLLRFAAIPFGLLTVFFGYLLARALFPGDGFLAVTVPAFVAFQPQISYEAAMVNNDIVCIALYSWLLYLMVVGIRDRFPTRVCVLTGFALGLALLSKGTSLTAVGLIGLAMLAAIGLRDLRGLVAKGAIVGGLAAVIAAPWFVFLWRTYGNFSGLPQVEEIQWWNYLNKDVPGFFDLLFNRDFALMRFHETWGFFGWRRIPLDDSILWAIGIPLVVALGGLVQYALTAGRRSAETEADPVLRPARWQTYGLLLMLVTCVLAYVAVVQFGTRFELTQARYYFPAINAAALLLMLGLRTLIPLRFHPQGRAAVFAALVVLNVLIYSQYVIPYWHLSDT